MASVHEYINYGSNQLVSLLNARLMTGIVTEVSGTEDKAKVFVYGQKPDKTPFGEMWLNLFYH